MKNNKQGAPIFVKIEEYKDILDVLKLLRDKMNEAKATLASINDVKNSEDTELETWNSVLGEIEKKLDAIDEALFEPDKAW